MISIIKSFLFNLIYHWHIIYIHNLYNKSNTFNSFIFKNLIFIFFIIYINTNNQFFKVIINHIIIKNFNIYYFFVIAKLDKLTTKHLNYQKLLINLILSNI